MKTQEIIEAIKIGFSKPKLYKRSVWNRAVRVMEFLSDHTNGDVMRVNFGPGLEKYKAGVEVNEAQLVTWAVAYKCSLPVSVRDAVSELGCIAQELGVKVNNGVVVAEYFNRHPEN